MDGPPLHIFFYLVPLLKENGYFSFIRPKSALNDTAVHVLTGETDTGEVVALGSGGACIAPGGLPTDGRTLLDSHAVVIARRAFLK